MNTVCFDLALCQLSYSPVIQKHLPTSPFALNAQGVSDFLPGRNTVQTYFFTFNPGQGWSRTIYEILAFGIPLRKQRAAKILPNRKGVLPE